MTAIRVDLAGQEHIALCDLLKLAGLAESGGRAKAVIAAGEVRRNGNTETRKTAKIRAGETVAYAGAVIEVFENAQE
ncbi:RNA-binding S4 domain-containing protein [Conchiformibius kuhniae]|uniref:RNA-binding S4 domain-containing protein n=1 Tax=Conchiformibius kuhniae TaxID=211502 RepID=A0A8T9MW48_9NEIS|nr:RNA-binding S4 domain-containing protein [Conchiformibius kuhniae]UOP05065.1 RNA-binding S4 domain-containing protein [Conchiformibius kuhniae]